MKGNSHISNAHNAIPRGKRRFDNLVVFVNHDYSKIPEHSIMKFTKSVNSAKTFAVLALIMAGIAVYQYGKYKDEMRELSNRIEKLENVEGK